MGEQIKVKRYYGLLVSSAVLKVLAILAVLFMLGGVGWFTVEAIELNVSNAFGAWWLPRVALLVLLGGLFAFMCVVLAQLIDVQIEENAYLRQLNENMTQVLAILKAQRHEQKVTASQSVGAVHVPITKN